MTDLTGFIITIIISTIVFLLMFAFEKYMERKENKDNKDKKM